MLTKENVEALLKTKTKTGDLRALRIMSCEGPVKDMYIFNLGEVRDYFNYIDNSFENQLLQCLLKFNIELNMLINPKENFTDYNDFLSLRHTTMIPNKCMAVNAYKELKLFKEILDSFLNCNTQNLSEFMQCYFHKLERLSLKDYTNILTFCGIVDVSTQTYRSKILSRLLNIKKQALRYGEGKILKRQFLEELQKQLEFLREQLSLIEKYSLYKEDLFLYALLFDLKPVKMPKINQRSYKE